MVAFTVKVNVWNPRKPEIKIDLDLLVDSGAIYRFTS
jgi:hypothetical protein